MAAGAAKGLTLGFAGKSAFALLGLLIKSRFSVARLLSYRYLPSALAGEPSSYGLFLGSLLAGLQATSDVVGPLLLPSSAIAGAAATATVGSLSLYFLPPSHRPSVCLFFAVRALEVACRWVGRRFVDDIPRVLREQLGTAMFCLGSAEICWAALYHTSALEPSYMAFLNQHSGKDVHSQLPLAALLHGAYNAAQPTFTTALHNLQRLRTLRRLPPLLLTQSAHADADAHAQRGARGRHSSGCWWSDAYPAAASLSMLTPLRCDAVALAVPFQSPRALRDPPPGPRLCAVLLHLLHSGHCSRYARCTR